MSLLAFLFIYNHFFLLTLFPSQSLLYSSSRSTHSLNDSQTLSPSIYICLKVIFLRNSLKRSMRAPNTSATFLHNMSNTTFYPIPNTFSSLLTEQFLSENSWLFYYVIQLLMNFVFLAIYLFFSYNSNSGQNLSQQYWCLSSIFFTTLFRFSRF